MTGTRYSWIAVVCPLGQEIVDKTDCSRPTVPYFKGQAKKLLREYEGRRTTRKVKAPS
jgi:hypothetical protein